MAREAPNGETISGAKIYLAREGQTPSASVISNGDGEFSFVGVLPGTYFIFADKAGFISSTFGQVDEHDYGTPFEVRLGENKSGMVVRMWRMATIAGRTLGRDGKPIEGAAVELLSPLWIGGIRSYRVSSQTRSNDQGDYSFLVMPGSYLVRGPSSGPKLAIRGVPPLYDAAFSAIEATEITVGVGGRREGIDLDPRRVNETHEIAGRVSGRVSLAGLSVVLRPAPATRFSLNLDLARTTVSSDGSFHFLDVPVGNYTLFAVSYPKAQPANGRAVSQILENPSAPGRSIPSSVNGILDPLPPGDTEWCELSVVVGHEDQRAVVLEMQPGFVVRGQLKFVGKGAVVPPPEVLSGTCIRIVPTDGRDIGTHPCGRVEADGTFTSLGVPGGRYTISVSRDFGGWYLASIRNGDSEISGRAIAIGSNLSGLEVTYRNSPATVSGTAFDASNRPLANTLVFAIDTGGSDARADGLQMPSRVIMKRTDLSGAFEFQLLPGTYSLLATKGTLPKDWPSQDVVERLRSAGRRVVVIEAKNVTQDLRVER